MTKVKSKITPDTILKNFWKDNNRFCRSFSMHVSLMEIQN